MFRATGARHPEDLTERTLTKWITSAGANNSVRARLATARRFVRWCLRHGYMTHDPTDDLGHITKSFPAVYGKAQDMHPARFLTYDEAYGDLVGACRTGTVHGLRDEVVIRLGLSGMRAAECRNLTVGSLQLKGRSPEIAWTGKGNRPRRLTPGPSLIDVITRLLAAWDHTPGPDEHVCNPAPRRSSPDTPLLWGQRMGVGAAGAIVTTRAQLAGLGHVAPHDLRRSAAAILHHSTTDDGAHRFDLLDIQRVLGHADPAVTMRSYLEPMDRTTTDRAASVLD